MYHTADLLVKYFGIYFQGIFNLRRRFGKTFWRIGKFAKACVGRGGVTVTEVTVFLIPDTYINTPIEWYNYI